MHLAVGPTIRSIFRRRVAFASIVLEVAFDLTVVLLSFVLADWFLALRGDELELDARALFVVESEPVGVSGAEPGADRAALHALGGVERVTWLERPPFVMPRNFDVVTASTGASHFAWLQEGGAELPEIYGLEVFVGEARVRGAEPETSWVLLSESLAQALFGSPALAVGQRLDSQLAEARVVSGVFRDVLFVSAAAMENRMSLMVLGAEPARLARRVALVRVEPSRVGDFPARAQAALEPLGFWTRVEAVTAYRDRDDRPWFAGTVIPLVVAVVMLVGALVGTFGMAAYAVAQRTRLIGIRRALGASREDILGHVLFETWIMTSVGLALGVLMAHGVLAVARRYEPELELDWPIVVLGVVAFWITGLAAAFFPALQAARVPPVTAARNV